MTIPAVIDRAPEVVNIVITAGNDFSAILEVEGDRAGDTFAAAFRRVGVATPTAFTSAVPSAYVPGTNITPVTITMTDTLTELPTTVYDRYYWDLKWTSGSSEGTIAGGRMYVKPKVVA
jgi:hypothetical protein